MQILILLLKESTNFTLNRQHWANSIILIGIAVILSIAGKELDLVLESEGQFLIVTELLGYYLMFVVFPIAWYRGVITTGNVTMDYRFTRRTWRYLIGCFKLTLLIGVIVIAVVIAIVAFKDSDFSEIPSFISWIGIWFVLLPLTYLLIRFEFILAAAANDRSMTLGEAWDSSRPIQGPLVGAVLIIQGLGGLVGHLLPDAEDSSMASVTYLIEAIEVIWSFIVQAFAIAATGIAYKKMQG